MKLLLSFGFSLLNETLPVKHTMQVTGSPPTSIFVPPDVGSDKKGWWQEINQ
jgi:hypothetical protein